MSATTILSVPDIGDFSEVEVIEILVKVGDTISAEQSLITVESDKASMEIPASHAGVVEKIIVQLGDKVAMGSAILEVTLGAAVASAPAAVEAPAVAVAAQAAAPTPAAPAPVAASSAPAANSIISVEAPPLPVKSSPTEQVSLNTPASQLPHASPSVRKFARELGVNLQQVSGTGTKNRILIEDVQQFVKQALSKGVSAGVASSGGASGSGLDVLPWPQVDFSKFGAIEAKPLSRIKKISGANLHRNWVMIPHVTNQEVADITDLEAFRVQLNKEHQKQEIKITMLAFLIKAVVAALKQFPDFNTSLDGDQLVYKQYYHIGFAADTPNGLVVPVLKDADKKGLLEIAQEMGVLAKKARDGKLSPAEMQGGCFSISSLGGIGGTSFTPIINAPEVAILGVSRSSFQPVWDGAQFVPRLMLPLSLSYDHRVIDGALAARFNAYLAAVLADYRRIIL